MYTGNFVYLKPTESWNTFQSFYSIVLSLEMQEYNWNKKRLAVGDVENAYNIYVQATVNNLKEFAFLETCFVNKHGY